MISTVGVIGNGQYGQFVIELARRNFPDIKVKVFSRRAEIDNQRFFDLKTVSLCDVVILCGAIADYEDQLKEVMEFISPDTIVVDVAIVKSYTDRLRKKYLEGYHHVSLHSLFGPQSYKKYGEQSEKLKIVVTDYALRNNDYQLLKEVFNGIGFDVIEMSPDEHDKFVAETLFVTHYVSRTLMEAGLKRTEIDTLSFQYLMDGVECVKSDEALFSDIYKFNPHCAIVAKRLHESEQKVWESLPKDE